MGVQVPNPLDVNVQMLRAVLEQPLPDVIDMIIYRGTTNNAEQATPFERFAAQLLVEAGAQRIRDIAAENDLEVIRLSTSTRFWIRCNGGELTEEQRDVLQVVESALNRIDYADDEAHEALAEGMPVSQIDERYYLAKSQQFLRNVSGEIRDIDELQEGENEFRTICGVEATRGGNWDIGTRFANVCEGLELPFRLTYRFDVDARTGVMVVRYGIPKPSVMPVAPQYRDGFVSAYAVRLAGLLAWGAFSSSVRLTQVDLTGCVGDADGVPVISMGFDRVPFMMGALPAMKKGDCDAVPLDVDPLALLNILKPVRYSGHFDTSRALTPIEPLVMPAVFLENRTPVWQDRRELPKELRGLLRADRACELDVMHEEDAPISAADVDAIVEENKDSPMVAELQLETALTQLGEAGEAKSGPNGEKPLYCNRPASRMMVSLLDGNERTRYWKVPDAVVDVHRNLGELALDNGDFERAERESQTCVDLGPTCIQHREGLSQVYGRNGDFGKTADTLVEALKLAVTPVDCEVLYYRLGYALWRIGRLPEALACYAMMVDGGTPFRHSAKDEAYELSQQMGLTSPDMTPAEAHAALRAGNVPVAPSDTVLNVLARAAVGLADAGFPLLAYDAAWVLGMRGGGDVVASMSASLRYGVERKDDVG